MNDNLTEYLNDLEQNTAITMENEQMNSRELAFTEYVLSQIKAKVGAENYVVCHATIFNSAGSNLGEIYAYNESANEEVLTLFYTIYDDNSATGIKILTDTDVQPAWNHLQGFYDRAIRGAYYDLEEDDPAYEISKMIDDHKNQYQTIRFYIISNCSIKQSAPRKLRVRGKGVDSNVWDIKKLAGNLTDSSNHVEINIDFVGDEDYNKYKVPYIQMDPDSSGYKCLLMMFPAKLLYKLYKKWNTDLLMYNVRYWLTFKKTKRKHTNFDIRETLRTNKNMFLAYNNGITAIATGIKVDDLNETTNVSEADPDGYVANDMVSMGMLREIRNFQIVNGGQTTASIFMAKKSEDKINLDGVFVQVKLIVLPQDNNVNEVAGNISRCSNTQNAVKESEFTVSEKFNTQMQKLSRDIIVPNDKGDISYWYYERIGGQYESERATHKSSKNDMEQFQAKYPKNHIFSKEIMAIARVAWEYKADNTGAYEPSEAVRGSGTTYDTFISSVREHSIIPDQNYYKDTVALLIMYNFLKSRPENKSYKNAKASVIAYTMAYVHYITFDTLDLLAIWNRQALTENQMIALNKLCEIMFKNLTEQAELEETSVLSYGKRKTAFKDICDKIDGTIAMELRNLILG